MKCSSQPDVVEVSRAHAAVLWGWLTETECTLYSSAPAPVARSGPGPSRDSLSIQSEVFCQQLIHHSSSCHLIIFHKITCRRMQAQAHSHTNACVYLKKNRKLDGKTMRLSSLLRKTRCPAVAPHTGRELKNQRVTAIVKAGAENLATTVNRLEGLVKSEQKAQF